MNSSVICDFDGTITQEDVIDKLLETLAVPGWQEIEEEWLAGKISASECLEREFSFVKADWPEIKAIVDTIEIDPSFPDFVQYCQERKYSLVIISDGFGFYINRILKRYTLHGISVYSNQLDICEKKPIITYSSLRNSCPCCGNCKAGYLNHLALQSGKKILIGDGLSDACLAYQVDLVFAKKGLLDYCQQKQLSHLAYTSFEDITQKLSSANNPAAHLVID